MSDTTPTTGAPFIPFSVLNEDIRAQLDRFANDPERCMPHERERVLAMLGLPISPKNKAIT